MGRVIGNGQSFDILNGTFEIGDVVNNGGTLWVDGQSLSTTVNAGGLDVVWTDGTAIGTQLNAGAQQIDF